MASTHRDELASSHDGSFRYWFICKSGGSQWPRLALILSTMWARRLKSEGTKCNLYKVAQCEGNFNATWGMLAEIRDADGQLSHMVAKVPDETTLDINVAEIEALFRRAKLDAAAKQVYDSIPMLLRPPPP